MQVTIMIQLVKYTVVCLYLTSTTVILAISIPELFTRGSHYEVGLDIGGTFKEQIREYFADDKLLQNIFIPWHNTPIGRKVYDEFLSVVTSSYPQYVAELKGIATGANIGFDKVFLANLHVELSALLRQNSNISSCSDIFVQGASQGEVLLGHNEDTTASVKSRGYIVHAEISGEVGAGMGEAFTAYSYPGEGQHYARSWATAVVGTGILPGHAFGFNQAGLVFSVNALYPKLVLTNKTGRNFLTRAVLAAHDMEAVEKIVSDDGTGAAYGFSLNVGELPKKAGSSARLWNVEVYPNRRGRRSTINVLPLSSRNSSDRQATNYFHVNLYRRMKVDEIRNHVMSSQHRARRIKSLPPAGTVSDVLAILGDQKDVAFPIYRVPSSTDGGCTVATALFDLQRCTMAVYKVNPKHSHAPLHTFRLPCRANRKSHLIDYGLYLQGI